MSDLFLVTEPFRAAYPKARAGVLALRGLRNPARCPALDERKRSVEQELRARYAGFARPDFAALPVLKAYADYYRRFRKTYHVQLQLESVVLKGKSLPDVASLVEAMFVAELRNLLLTAGHDLDAVQAPARLDVATGAEFYCLLNGQEQATKAGDMYIADGEGIISSVLHGPDRRTQITPATKRALFTVYAPAGVEEAAVRRHLADIRDNALLIAPDAEVEELAVYP
jgi:DNA/RNA-binding domain of Phe-tRNA-synthetase-like protein